jgi:hypothetical protein
MTALTGQNLLLLYIRDKSAIMILMATHAILLLLHCVQDDPAIMMATHVKPKLQLIVASIRTALSARSTISIQEKFIVVLDSEGEPDGCRLIINFDSDPLFQSNTCSPNHSKLQNILPLL